MTSLKTVCPVYSREAILRLEYDHSSLIRKEIGIQVYSPSYSIYGEIFFLMKITVNLLNVKVGRSQFYYSMTVWIIQLVLFVFGSLSLENAQIERGCSSKR